MQGLGFFYLGLIKDLASVSQNLQFCRMLQKLFLIHFHLIYDIL